MGWCDCEWSTDEPDGVLRCLVCGHVLQPHEWDEADPFGSLTRIAHRCYRRRRIKLVVKN